jgi:hypothetical protein
MADKVGRPPKYKTAKELEDKIHEYFTKDVKKRKVLVGGRNNKKMIEIDVPTITGLAIYLGFESRQSFYDYEERPEFSYTIKRARLFIENEYEELLQHGNTIGAIFALKNLGWVDAKETTIKTEQPLFGD